MIENKTCPNCGKAMIEWGTGRVHLTYPLQHPWIWRCACGHTEEGGVHREATADERFKEAWDRANGPTHWKVNH